MIAEQLHEILYARDADGQREVEFGKNLPEQAGLAEAGRDEHEHCAIFRFIKMLQEQLADERFAGAAIACDHAERSVKIHGEHHAAKGLGMAVGAKEKAGMDRIGERVFAKSVIADEIGGRREWD